MGTTQEFSGWGVRAMSEDIRKETAKARHLTTAGIGILVEDSTASDVEQKVE